MRGAYCAVRAGEQHPHDLLNNENRMNHIMQNAFISRRRVVTLICAACTAWAAGNAMAAGTVNINGSTTVLPVMQQVSEAFMQKHAGVTVTISGTGSGNGIKALRDKMTDVAMSSRDLKAKETADFEKHGIRPVRTAVALDAIIPVVSPKNAIADLTKEQIRDIFAGKITNWKDVGGADAPIVVVGRDSSSGTFECWQDLVMGKTRVSPRALLQSSNGGVVQAVTTNPNAIGYIGVGYLDGQVKGVSVNGVKPGAQTAKNGTWPISRELYLFTAGEPKGDAGELIGFTLSAEGQALVEKSGFVPVTK